MDKIQDALENVAPLPDPSPSAVSWWYDTHDDLHIDVTH